MKDSAYKTRIQKQLAKLSIALTPVTLAQFKCEVAGEEDGLLPTTIIGDDEFRPVRFYYSLGQKCDLCGHNPIKRVYVIESVHSGQEAHIGCDCAKNYLDIDIVEGLTKLFQIEYNKIVNVEKYADEVLALEWAKESRFALPYNLKACGVENIDSRYDLVHGGDASSVLTKLRDGKGISKRERQVMEIWDWFYTRRGELAVVKWFSDAVQSYRLAAYKAKAESQIVATSWKNVFEFGEVALAAQAAISAGTISDDYDLRRITRFVEDFTKGPSLTEISYDPYFRVDRGVDRWSVDEARRILERVAQSGEFDRQRDIIAAAKRQGNLSPKESKFLDDALERLNGKRWYGRYSSGRNKPALLTDGQLKWATSIAERTANATADVSGSDPEIDALFEKLAGVNLGKRKSFIDSLRSFYAERGFLTPNQKGHLRKNVAKLVV
jgi:hypothetical protein